MESLDLGLDPQELNPGAFRCTGEGQTCPCQACARARWALVDEARARAFERERLEAEARARSAREIWARWVQAARRLYGPKDPRALTPKARKARAQALEARARAKRDEG